ncbi:UNVERIFIED_CONTAM: hypothetical protein HDU68_000346 [Siphonaria sp. JEL0065]|nr:hypothetical protein HDU68_000346 [Siphonaria sp. JEL0065]
MSAVQFFKAPRFAVVGASADQSKFGNRVLRWYIKQKLPVTPINPKSDVIESISCVKQIAELGDSCQYSLSLIVPPVITLQVLNQAKSLGFKNLWLQPGCENADVLNLVNEWRDTDSTMNVILGGPCILVEGEYALHSVDRSHL